MKFETEWKKMKRVGYHGAFKFSGTADEWRSTVASHFKKRTLQRPCYGAYIVRQSSIGKVIYVGKSGTLCQDGSFKNQDLQKRLDNREKGRSRKEVFGERVVKHGELLVEYIVQKSQSLIPGYLEARLLQAYFDDHQRLPTDNASL